MKKLKFMKLLSKIGWFLFDVLAWIYDILAWIVKLCVRMIKKIIKTTKHFFSRENFQKNKKLYFIVIVIALIIFSSSFFIFRKYKIIIIPKDEKKQSVAQKTCFNVLKRAEVKQTETKQINAKNQVAPEDVSADEAKKSDITLRRVSLRGNVKKVEEGRVIIVTDKKEEKAIDINEKTRIIPTSKKLEVDQLVTVSAHLEKEEIIADRISIRPSTSTQE